MRSSVWCREVDDDNEVVMVPPCSVCLVCVFLHIVYNTPKKVGKKRNAHVLFSLGA